MGTEIQIQKVEHIQGWPLTVVRGEKQPLIEDEELGRKLGFDRPRRIRELIARIFNDSELCRTVRQSRGRSATVFYLTRSQALKVIMRSETPTADRVQDEIIAVYEAWLDGHLGPRKGWSTGPSSSSSSPTRWSSSSSAGFSPGRPARRNSTGSPTSSKRRPKLVT